MQDVEPLPSPRARRRLIGLLTLLLILLPLYLWPLRGGLGGLPSGAALSRSLPDPRSAAAVARIPGDVWDALMGHPAVPRPPLPPTKPLPNLTMITPDEGIPDSGLGEGSGGTLLSDSASSLVRGMLAQFGSSELSDGNPGGGDASFPPAEFLASNPGGGTGTGNPPSGLTSGGFPVSVVSVRATAVGPAEVRTRRAHGRLFLPTIRVISRRHPSQRRSCWSDPISRCWVWPRGDAAAGWGSRLRVDTISGDKIWSFSNHLLASPPAPKRVSTCPHCSPSMAYALRGTVCVAQILRGAQNCECPGS